ncbi:hypothetical protein [Streptomyces sp. NPDC006551]|uniref:hypothetical protein n=1 Tax=Streptomyces sp. NPDC006551 TaxID=3157178 RepID=UPI0033A79B00
MSGEAFGFDVNDDSDEVIPEEWPTFYTPVPVWVLLSGCSAQAYRMYAFLAEHINNRTPGKRIAFPSQKALAKAMVLKDYRDVAKYRQELADLGAIRFEEFRYAGGMRRRYRYWVRFNPPEGYSGLVSLAEFYEANPDVKAKRSQPLKDAAEGVPAGQSGGGKKPTSGGGKKPRSRGGESPTAQQPDPEQPDPLERDVDAPSGRSPVDERSSSSAGSSAGARESGSAASGKTKPSPTTQKTAAAGRKAKHTKAELDVVRQVRAYYPPEFGNDLPELPTISDAILSAMTTDGRTPEQIGERILYRWIHHGYADKFHTGTLENPVGAAIGMVRPLRRGDRYACADPRCENGRDIDTGEECRLCEVRAADWKAAQARKRQERGSQPSAPLPAQRGATSGPSYRECVEPACRRPIVAREGDPYCAECRADAAAAQEAAAAVLASWEEQAAHERLVEDPVSAVDEDAAETARIRAQLAAQYGTPDQVDAYVTGPPF